MTKEEFRKEAEAAFSRLPEEFKKNVSNLEIVLDDAAAKSGEALLLGLYSGVPVSERGAFYAGALPDKITLFRKNIESICRNDGEVKSEIKKTIIHEIAHHFGMDEKTIRKAGF